MPKDKLEKDFKNCLELLITLYQEKTDQDKVSIIYQSKKLFKTEEILFDLFFRELTE